MYPYWTICWILSPVVYEEGGRTVAVQPETQIVEPIVACVTDGLKAPGVRTRLGSPGRRPVARAVGSIVAAGVERTGAPPAVAPSSTSVDGLPDGASVVLGADVSGAPEVPASSVGEPSAAPLAVGALAVGAPALGEEVHAATRSATTSKPNRVARPGPAEASRF